MNLKFEFVLGSESPRRKKLLEEAGFKTTVFPVQVSESLEKNLTVEAQIQTISTRKWRAACAKWNQTIGRVALLLTADTMVVLDGQALGKPADSQDAIQTLERLSGRAHQVMTAVTMGLTSSPAPTEKIVTTDVIFRLISRQEIVSYVQSGEPMDKAGSYGIQGLAKNFVEKLEGDYNNVVGLPVQVVRTLIQEQGWGHHLK